jgi:hypothetical protein
VHWHHQLYAIKAALLFNVQAPLPSCNCFYRISEIPFSAALVWVSLTTFLLVLQDAETLDLGHFEWHDSSTPHPTPRTPHPTLCVVLGGAVNQVGRK